MTAAGDEFLSSVERRMRVLLTERTSVVETTPAPCVVIVDLEARRHAPPAASGPERFDPRTRLLEEGAGHLDAVADLEQVMARAAAA